MANSNNWGEIYKSTWWGDKAWSANTLFIDSAPPGFGLNLLKASEDMDNTLDWITRTGASVSAQNTNDPNGELTAERVDFVANVNSRIQQLVTLEASTTYTFSVHARVPSGQPSQDFRLKALGVTGVGSFTALSSDWTRFDFDFTTTTAGTYTLAIMNATDGAARSIQFWGAMLNEGADVGGYVKTEASVGGSSPTPEYSGFGDEFVGVTAYYSLRQFTEAETLNAIRVRRSSDDTEQDIGFDANGDLDSTALLAFVNADVDTYTSDFTSGNEDMAEVNGTGADGQSIAGVDDAYKFTLSGGAVAHYTRTDSSFDKVNSYDVSFDYYIPSGQTINGIRVRTGTTSDGEYDQTTLDAWTSVAIENWTPTSKSTCRFNALVGSSIDPIDADGDVFYLKNIVVTQTTADGAVTTWYDQTGNGNNATNSTESEQPLVVSGGTLVEENSKAALDFDGVDDYLAKIATFTINGDHMISAVHTPEGVGGYLFSMGYNDSESVLLWNNATNYSRYWLSGSGDQLNSAETAVGQRLTTGEFASGTQTLYIDGTQNSTKSTTYSGGNVPDITIGYAVQRAQGSNYLIGKVQELIFFNSDQSANRTGIESNINDHFDIYT
jgi:hypothetical protein